MERQGAQVKKLEANHAHLIHRNNFKVLIFQVRPDTEVRGQVHGVHLYSSGVNPEHIARPSGQQQTRIQCRKKNPELPVGTDMIMVDS